MSESFNAAPTNPSAAASFTPRHPTASPSEASPTTTRAPSQQGDWGAFTRSAEFAAEDSLVSSPRGRPSEASPADRGLSPPTYVSILPERSASRSPSRAGLHVKTDLTVRPRTPTDPAVLSPNNPTIIESRADTLPRAMPPSPTSAQGVTGLRSALSTASLASSLSPGSAMSSPALNALADITPLPSPMIMSDDDPAPQRRRSTTSRPASQGSASAQDAYPWGVNVFRSTSKRKKNYPGLMPTAYESAAAAAASEQQQKNEQSHGRNRSISEYAPEHIHNARPRNVTLSHGDELNISTEPQLHREQYLAEQRGLCQNKPQTVGTSKFPTPPPSNRSSTESEEEDAPPAAEHLTVRQGPEKRKRYYRPVRALGQGTFSKVVLATSEAVPGDGPLEESALDPAKLVAIKIVEHGPAGGADEERVELSLKREVEIMQSVSHPSLVRLNAVDFGDAQALLVLSYCPGGDLFELASAHRDLLTARVVQRIFAELVGAVRYLHTQYIVHRDIKLENVLLNIPIPTLHAVAADPSRLSTPHPLITLTDLGLSRRIPPPPSSPLLTTRCGSEDYAAPEILLGQPYDGRATDAWALGVLLYALIEGQLPFDPPPSTARAAARRSRGRVAHRIARCDWGWWRFGDEDGEWDADKKGAVEWEGARPCVEALLKKVSRGRAELGEMEGWEWVRAGIGGGETAAAVEADSMVS